MKTNVADICNIGKFAGGITAGMFLSFFLKENINFLHFDIAGTAFNDSKNLSTSKNFMIIFNLFKLLSVLKNNN